MIIHGRQRNTELGQVAGDSAEHDHDGENRSGQHGARNQQKDRGYKFKDATSNSTPRLSAESAEYIHGLTCTREFEEQCLQQNDCRDEPEKPARHDDDPIVLHALLSDMRGI